MEGAETDPTSIKLDDEIQDMENAVASGTKEMDKARGDDKELRETLDQPPAGATPSDQPETDIIQKLGSIGSLDKDLTDSKIFCQLQEAQRETKQIATIITELKQNVAQLLEKPHMTDLENIELEQKNKQLASLLQDFERRTRQIQKLVSQIDKRTGELVPGIDLLGMKQIEDILPKVIICGTTEFNVPRIIICDADKKKKEMQSLPSFQSPPAASIMPLFAQGLPGGYNIEERGMEKPGFRCQFQDKIVPKDRTYECLQQTIDCLQSKLRGVITENTILSEKLNKMTDPSHKCKCNRPNSYRNNAQNLNENMPGFSGRGICPGDVESRLENYSNVTNVLRGQLEQMEAEVKSMQKELESVQKERAVLEQQKKALLGGKYQDPCSPCSRCPGGTTSCSDGKSSCDQQLRELREQYRRLQEDYRDKLTEVAQLRAEVALLKDNVKDAECAKEHAMIEIKEKEREIKCLRAEINKNLGSKEHRAEQERQLTLLKQKLNEAQDELDELRCIIGDQTAQLEEYRNKFMQAQQTVEEQRRQIDMMELENRRVGDQFNLEIQRIKNQFQEKINELTSLTEVLKATQIKLQESQQAQLCAERRVEKFECELQRAKEREMTLLMEIEKLKQESSSESSNTGTIRTQLQQCEKKIIELTAEMNSYKKEITRLEDLCLQHEKDLEEKKHEIYMLHNQLIQLREESARQVARARERTDTVRRTLQCQISDLERQLVHSRAACRSAQKERDEIRQKMQCQINNLNENFEEAQNRIRNLQGHVNFLKTSYSCTFHETGDGNQGDICICPSNANIESQ